MTSDTEQLFNQILKEHSSLLEAVLISLAKHQTPVEAGELILAYIIGQSSGLRDASEPQKQAIAYAIAWGEHQGKKHRPLYDQLVAEELATSTPTKETLQ